MIDAMASAGGEGRGAATPIRVLPDSKADQFSIRRAVFMEEQGYESEFDSIDDDARCRHVVAYWGDLPVACARVFPEELEGGADSEAPRVPACPLDEGIVPGGVFLIGRVAVLPGFRGRGLARRVLSAAEEEARRAGAGLIKLHSQEHVMGLYASQGYSAISDVDFEDEGQPHVWMAKRLAPGFSV